MLVRIHLILRDPVEQRRLRRLMAGEGTIVTAEPAHRSIAESLAQIPWPIERRPVTGRFGPSRVITFPPAGAGRTLIEMLNILEQFPIRQHSPDSPKGPRRNKFALSRPAWESDSIDAIEREPELT